MQIPRSQGRDTAKPTLQQHTPMTGLSSLGNVIGGAVQARDDKLREQEAQSKMIGLYHDQIAEQEAKVSDIAANINIFFTFISFYILK